VKGQVCLITKELMKNKHFIDVKNHIHYKSCQNNNYFADMQNQKHDIWLKLKPVE
jgi:hypothetical protein